MSTRCLTAARTHAPPCRPRRPSPRWGACCRSPFRGPRVVIASRRAPLTMHRAPSLAPQAGPAGPHAAVSRLCAQVKPCVHPPLSVRPRVAAPVVRCGPPRTLNTRAPHTRSTHALPHTHAPRLAPTQRATTSWPRTPRRSGRRSPSTARWACAVRPERAPSVAAAATDSARPRCSGCERATARVLHWLRARARTCAAVAVCARARAAPTRPLAAPAFPLHTRVPHACSTAPLRPLVCDAITAPQYHAPREPSHHPPTARTRPPTIHHPRLPTPPPSLPRVRVQPRTRWAPRWRHRVRSRCWAASPPRRGATSSRPAGWCVRPQSWPGPCACAMLWDGAVGGGWAPAGGGVMMQAGGGAAAPASGGAGALAGGAATPLMLRARQRLVAGAAYDAPAPASVVSRGQLSAACGRAAWRLDGPPPSVAAGTRALPCTRPCTRGQTEARATRTSSCWPDALSVIGPGVRLRALRPLHWHPLHWCQPPSHLPQWRLPRCADPAASHLTRIAPQLQPSQPL